ncbi:MAG: alpha/beta hydrolase [Thermoleophilaceae bacterium]|nr:alpha/beta hydrolase [Thermoleophilaceae bacterium]
MNSQNEASVVLVHGAFADGSSWEAVIAELQRADIPVTAPANPLRGVEHDGAYIASVAGEIDGPVILVGHSYGGVVITQAADRASNVVGLVYVAAFALDAGERPLDVITRFPEAAIGSALRPATRPGMGGEPQVELSIEPAQFPNVFGADLPADRTSVGAVSQRPVVASVFEEVSPAAAWKRLPSWYVVSGEDHAIHPDAQRFMARRAEATTIETDGSHSVALSRPEAVVDAIRAAVAVVVPQAV